MKTFHLALVIFLVSVPALLRAQIVIPRGVEAGNIDDLIKSNPTPSMDSIPEKKYRPLGIPEGSEKARFVLSDIKIEGVKAYKPDRFVDIYAGSLGNEVSLEDIYVMVDKIRRIYHEDGYILTQVFLPEQTISSGSVRISVVEGYVSRLRFEGAEIKDDIIKKMSRRITDEKPFNGKTLESVMLRLNELVGIEATSTLEPLAKEEAEPGAAGLVISITNEKESGSIRTDSNASRYLGAYQLVGIARAHRLFGAIDELQATVSNSFDPERLGHFSLRYSRPVSDDGSLLWFETSRSKTNPGFRLENLDIFSRAKSFSLGFSKPLIRSRTENLTLDGSFNVKNLQTKVLDSEFSSDRIRTLEFSLGYNFSDSWGGSNLFSSTLGTGVDILDAKETGSPNLSRARGRSDFHKLTLNASRLQTLSDDFSLFVSASGQRANSALLSSEQFGLGGTNFGRAYDFSEISGDNGFGAGVELRYQRAIGNVFVQPFTFYEIGKTWENEPNGDILSIASVGFGGRIRYEQYSFEALMGVPLTFTPATPKLGSAEKDPRFSLSFTVDF